VPLVAGRLRSAGLANHLDVPKPARSGSVLCWRAVRTVGRHSMPGPRRSGGDEPSCVRDMTAVQRQFGGHGIGQVARKATAPPSRTKAKLKPGNRVRLPP
jgi:hypothetical protein